MSPGCPARAFFPRSGGTDYGILGGMKRILFLLPAMLCVAVLRAQYVDYSRMGKTPAELMFIDDPMDIELKEPSWWWHDPEKDSPAEQLAYARSLEADGKIKDAIGAYDDLVHEWHATPEALKAQLSIARLHSAAGDAAAAYDADIYLLAHFSGRFEMEPVLKDALAQADLLAGRAETGFLGLRRYSHNALRANYERIIHFAPRWVMVPDLLMRIGALYSDAGQYASALTIYDTIIVRWPGTARMDEVVYCYAEACRRQADVWRNDTGRLQNLERLIAGAVAFRPAHPSRALFETWQREIYEMRREGSYVKAVFYDNPKAYSVDAAIRAYQAFLQQFPDAPQAPAVRARIAELSVSDRLSDAPNPEPTP